MQGPRAALGRHRDGLHFDRGALSRVLQHRLGHVERDGDGIRVRDEEHVRAPRERAPALVARRRPSRPVILLLAVQQDARAGRANGELLAVAFQPLQPLILLVEGVLRTRERVLARAAFDRLGADEPVEGLLLRADGLPLDLGLHRLVVFDVVLAPIAGETDRVLREREPPLGALEHDLLGRVDELVGLVHLLELRELVLLIVDVRVLALLADVVAAPRERDFLSRPALERPACPVERGLREVERGGRGLVVDLVLLDDAGVAHRGRSRFELGLMDLLVDRARLELRDDVALLDGGTLRHHLGEQELARVRLRPERHGGGRSRGEDAAAFGGRRSHGLRRRGSTRLCGGELDVDRGRFGTARRQGKDRAGERENDCGAHGKLLRGTAAGTAVAVSRPGFCAGRVRSATSAT